MKKITVIALCVFILLSTVCTNVLASAGSANLTASVSKAKPGDKVEFVVSVANFSEVDSMSVSVTVPDGLTVQNGKWLLSGFMADYMTSMNRGVWGSTNIVNLSAKTDVFKLTCEVNEPEVGQQDLFNEVKIVVEVKADGSSKGKLETSAQVEVFKPATELTLNKQTLQFDLSGTNTEQLVATVNPQNTTETLSWSSSNNEVATVSADGTVTAVAEGEAVITACVGELEKKCTVTVVGGDINVISGTTGDCTWTLKGTVLTISGNGEMGNYSYSSPWMSEYITEVVIEDGVTSIGDYAFCFCYSLKSITIGDSVTSIGNYAFYNCSSLTSITIPDSVTSIGNYAFSSCDSLTSITIPDSVTSIGDYAFSWCECLTSITIPDSVTSIGDNAFSCCDSLTSITIPDSVTSIGNYAFFSCDSLTSIAISDSVTSIGDWAFSCCYSLTSITIPDSVTSIGDNAFSWCNNLTSITIPDSVTSIGNYAFNYCDSLTTVYYCGTEEQWNSISIDYDNSYLINATRYYHNFGDWQTRTELTCTQNGEKYRTCAICGEEEIETIIATGHNYNTVTTPSTCTEDGCVTHTCSVCNTVETETLYATGHNYISGKCESCNSYIESKHDYDTEYDETWIISKENTASITITFSSDTFVEQKYDFIYIYDGNDNEIGKYTGGELASKSVTVSGNTAKIRLCSDRINTAYGFKVTNIEFACAHNYITEIKNPTCTEEGYTIHTCEYCGDVYYSDYVNVTGHDYFANVKEPTCIESGRTTFTCKDCGDSYIGDFTNPTGHNYTAVIKEPICIEKGYTIHTCVNCGDSYIDSYTDATGVHIYENGNCTQCNGYLESEHEYATEYDETWTIHRKGATSITLTFSAETFVEQKYDFIYIYDGNDNEIGKYTGGELASKSVTVSGNTVKIRLSSDRIVTAYGFKLTDISAEYVSGDFNADGKFNVLDFIYTMKVLAGVEESNPNIPDLDGNGILNALDLVMVKKYLLGILKF